MQHMSPKLSLRETNVLGFGADIRVRAAAAAWHLMLGFVRLRSHIASSDVRNRK
jgi:hypothetical protein